MLRGVAAVRSGRTFSLAFAFDPNNGPQTGAIPGRHNLIHVMTGINTSYTGDPDGVCYSEDFVTMGPQFSTHWDALAHVSYSGKLYNDFDAGTISAERGAARCGADRIGVVTGRGVLLDVARHFGVDVLEPGYCISGDDLQATADAQGVSAQTGDIVLVRTGQMQRLLTASGVRDKNEYRNQTAGLSTRSIEWFADHETAAVATDTFALEPWPAEFDEVLTPVHMIQLRDLGLLQGQIWNLEELAADSADDRQFDFLLQATPLPLKGAVGTPVHPVAVK